MLYFNLHSCKPLKVSKQIQIWCHLCIQRVRGWKFASFSLLFEWTSKCDDERKLLQHIACNYVLKKTKLNFYKEMIRILCARKTSIMLFDDENLFNLFSSKTSVKISRYAYRQNTSHHVSLTTSSSDTVKKFRSLNCAAIVVLKVMESIKWKYFLHASGVVTLVIRKLFSIVQRMWWRCKEEKRCQVQHFIDLVTLFSSFLYLTFLLCHEFKFLYSFWYRRKYLSSG
jgi:hypothetical protein